MTPKTPVPVDERVPVDDPSHRMVQADLDAIERVNQAGLDMVRVLDTYVPPGPEHAAVVKLVAKLMVDAQHAIVTKGAKGVSR
jgi:hypothetical protein